jgi:hypothetical protein
MAKLDANGQDLNPYPAWAPRFWHGMLLSGWLRLLWPHLWRIHPLRIAMAVIVTFCAAVNSLLCAITRLCFGRAIARTAIDKPPVFILGHWRSGTTYLHELLVLDDQFTFPTTYECFAANHFVLTGWILPRLLGFLLPAKRPNDDMAVSFDHPQEDEFALVALGAPSPMLRLAFPNDPPAHMNFLDMEGVDEKELARWKKAMLDFVRAQTYLKGKTLVLKSPPHTGRIRLLAELFPGAKFIHLVRDPYALFPSTRRLWYALEQVQGFQVPRNEYLDEYVFSSLERMYRGFERQRAAIPDAQICELRYEDLARDPLPTLQHLYEQLDLGDFQRVRDRMAASVNQRQGYRKAKHTIAAELKAAIRQRWAFYFERYGYDRESLPIPATAAAGDRMSDTPAAQPPVVPVPAHVFTPLAGETASWVSRP